MANEATKVVMGGVSNLVKNCVGVERGESILLLNENDGVDRNLVDLMEEAIRLEGGVAYSLWVDSMAGANELPAVVAGAILATDKLVLNASLNRLVLLEHLRANNRAELIRINNRSRTAEAFSTEHALFNWKVVIALAGKIQEATSSANEWRITSPYGTDISGRIASSSEVADAFFAQDAEASRTERVFPGEVYSPVGSSGAQGVIAFDHPGFSDKDRFRDPMMLTVEDGVLIKVGPKEDEARQGQGDDATGNTVWTRDQLLKLLETNAENYGAERAYTVDSWHGGMHPKAVRKAGQQSNPDTMHFHIGNVPAARSAYVSDQTITLDGKLFWVEGRPALLDDSMIQDLAAELGVSLS